MEVRDGRRRGFLPEEKTKGVARVKVHNIQGCILLAYSQKCGSHG
jgi:hypothetical protein